MKYSFLGFLFIFLDFKITFAYGGTVNFLPNFVGYLFLFLAVRNYGHENDHFRRLRLFSPIAVLLSLAVFVLELLPFSLPTAATLVISVAMTAMALYLAYEFAEGAKALERSLYKKFDADKISAAWIILSMTSLLEFLVIYLPAVALPCYLVHWLAVAWFESATFHFEKKLAGKE